MRRLRLGVFTVSALCALAGPARAAEITRVATTEPGDPFDLQITLRWDRVQERARISREVPVADGGVGRIDDLTVMRYSRTTNALVPRIAVALYTDLELHLEVPYVLGDDTAWRYGFRGGLPVDDASPGSPGANTIDAMGAPCVVTPCGLFPVAPETTVYHGGKAGDVKAGLAWGIFNDRRDDTKPFWLVGFDITFPSAQRYDPAAGRPTDQWISPFNLPAKPGPFGEKVWKYDLYTALSRRMGPADPYFRAHVTAMRPSNATYSNCEHAADLAARTVPEMTTQAATNCATSRWEQDAGAQLPFLAGVVFGAELVPFEDPREDQKVTLDVRLGADYTSKQRFFNELTDASGKLHMTEGYLTMGGQIGLYLKASRYVSLEAVASLATKSPHLLTGESLGKGAVRDGDISGATPNPDLNPNFDWRYDAPGNRFRISEVSVFSLSVAGVLRF